MNTTFCWFLSGALRLRRLGLITFLVLTRIVTTTSEAQALNIKLKQAPPTPPPIQIQNPSPIGGVGQGEIGSLPTPAIFNVEAPGKIPQTIGSGNFVNTIRAAANCWEQALANDNNPSIPDQLTLDIGVAPFNVAVPPPSPSNITGYPGNTIDIDGLLAVHGINAGQNKTLSDGTTVFRETEGTILFNDNPNAIFYVDSTPGSAGYTNFSSYDSNLGAGPVNVSRDYTLPATSDAANGYDLFSVAMHEIGHALGLSAANPAAIATLGSGSTIDIQNPYPIGYAGTSIDTTYQNPIFGSEQNDVHLAYSGSVMYSTINAGERKLLTGADILAAAGVRKYQNVDLSACQFNPQSTTLIPVSEPSTIPALLLGGGAAIVIRRRWRGR